MPDSLYRSYSLEKSLDDGQIISSGNLTLWEDEPVSPLNVGDSFSPVPDGPTLKVKKVNISDNVIGIVAGKTVRQWQISIEGDNQNEISASSQTHILYKFQFDADEHSGTMEVTNTGDAPAVNLAIGDLFNVPGVGRIPCVNISGSDSYDDDGNHIWSIVYEGSDIQDKQDTLPENKYTFSIESSGAAVVHSGSIAKYSECDSPSLEYQIGDDFSIPGIGQVTCTKISASDDYSDSGGHIWTITYEGSNESSQQADTLPKVKYSFSIDKDGSSYITSGSMQVVNAGNAPVLSLNVGETFPFPGIGGLTCVNISGSDEYSDSGKRIWTVTYEGIVVQSQQPKYSLSLTKNGNSSVASGSIQMINDGNAPTLSYNIGSTINIPGLGDITCVEISANDEISEGGVRRWTVTYEGANEFTQNTKYSFTIDRNGNSCRLQVINEGNAPILSINVGDPFSIPGIGQVTCTSISASDEYSDSGARVWNVTYESNPEQLAQSQQTVKYSLNIDKEGASAVQSGSMQVINEGNAPALSVNVGEAFTIPGLGEVICTSISASDEYSDSGARVWNVTYESNNKQSHNVKYSFSFDKEGDSAVFSGTMQVTNIGDEPALSINVGDPFHIPGIGEVDCTNISASDEYSEGGLHVWTVTYESKPQSSTIEENQDDEGEDHETSSEPEDEVSVSYELNGITTRSVTGEFIALVKSESHITKKTITIYNESKALSATPGSTYEGGIALSETIVKETIKKGNKAPKTYYKHTIEVEV